MKACAASLLLHTGLAVWAIASVRPPSVEEPSWQGSVSVPMRAPREEVVVPEFEPPGPVPPLLVVDEPPPEPVLLPESPAPWAGVEPECASEGTGVPPPPCDPTRTHASVLAAKVPVPATAAPVVAAAQREIGTDTVTTNGALVEASPKPGTNQPPEYPFVAWRRGVEGSVTVLLDIDAAGAVIAVRIETSSGNRLLDDAAVKKLGTWRFTPAMRAGMNVPSTFRQVVVFRLSDRG